MFCKYCGKNIYDLEKCPFCNDGEKLNAQDANETSEADVQNNIEEVRETVESAQETPTASLKKEEKATDPEKKPESFDVRLKRESKGYKVLSILKSVVFGFQIGIPVLQLIINWFNNRGTKFQYVLSKTLYDVVPIEVWLMFLSLAFGIALTIVYVNAAKKKNATDNELGAALTGLSLETSSLFDPLHAISLRYDKSLFIVSVMQTVFSIIDMLVLAVAVRILVPLCYTSLKTYGIFTNGFKNDVSIAVADYLELLIAIVVIFVITEIVTVVLRLIRNSKTKELVRKTGINIPKD
ncbi:MAG: hypothetical protein IJC80_05110 [Clostridia bacterium]|nr:hypothetical protein [Clostridia bacterium]